MKNIFILMLFLTLIGTGCFSTTTEKTAVDDSMQTVSGNEMSMSTENEPQTDSTPENNKIDIKESEKIVTDNNNALKIFTITASRWKFDPAVISVNKDDSVRLLIKSTDVTHGFYLPEFGINEQLEPGKTATVEFIADKAGTYSFSCNVFCGAGHTGMKGNLIVE